MKTIKFLSITMLSIFVLSSCSDDDSAPEQVNEEELITTMAVSLQASSGTTVTLTSRDLDGDGPNEPEITVSGNLDANTTYSGSIQVLNETEDPAENITLEVAEEGEEHQFFYQANSSLNATTTYNDMDADGNPIGINFTLITGDASTGNLTITLRHEGDKDAEGVSDGNIANAGGETDIAQTFNLTIQ